LVMQKVINNSYSNFEVRTTCSLLYYYKLMGELTWQFTIQLYLQARLQQFTV